jgi:periplasmic divalent cation tolerance protein
MKQLRLLGRVGSIRTKERSACLAAASWMRAGRQASRSPGPVRYMYWYEGDLGDAPDWQPVITTSAERFPGLEQHIKEHHPYGMPEICVMPITGNADYLGWFSDETRL